MSNIQNVAIIGCGAIGASWAALYVAQGLAVRAFDVNPAAEASMRRLVEDALPVLASIGLVKKAGVKSEDIMFTTNMADALQGADFVQENGPERLDFKRQLLNDMAAHIGPDTIISSSSSGLKCSSMQEGMTLDARPQRLVIGHPFNPPHLMPLVEVVGGDQTDPKVIERTLSFYKNMGKKAIHVKKEAAGHVANRLQAALVRESLYILQEGICDVSEIDDAVSFGPGLRWGIMGPSILMHLGGGEGGIEHMTNHLLGPMTTWWAPQDPVVDEVLKKKWIDGALSAVAGREYRDLAKQRDEELVRLLNVRKEWDSYAQDQHKA
ncbi:putative 3-hydroxyacyl-CoA dehydrogenase [Seiridium cardinale]|uniref:3-hydroxyacyl-CoA dehydrogenase n=1 Tax=Seiridium cardinale TaxID=138064 RepID=A0ABR2XW74_9PEZI